MPYFVFHDPLRRSHKHTTLGGLFYVLIGSISFQRHTYRSETFQRTLGISAAGSASTFTELLS